MLEYPVCSSMLHKATSFLFVCLIGAWCILYVRKLCADKFFWKSKFWTLEARDQFNPWPCEGYRRALFSLVRVFLCACDLFPHWIVCLSMLILVLLSWRGFLCYDLVPAFVSTIISHWLCWIYSLFAHPWNLPATYNLHGRGAWWSEVEATNHLLFLEAGSSRCTYVAPRSDTWRILSVILHTLLDILLVYLLNCFPVVIDSCSPKLRACFLKHAWSHCEIIWRYLHKNRSLSRKIRQISVSTISNI